MKNPAVFCCFIYLIVYDYIYSYLKKRLKVKTLKKLKMLVTNRT